MVTNMARHVLFGQPLQDPGLRFDCQVLATGERAQMNSDVDPSHRRVFKRMDASLCEARALNRDELGAHDRVHLVGSFARSSA